jgi:Flp pilus assembly pilin Flp
MPYPVPQNSGKATASMVLGIVGVVACGFIAGIPAIILGKQARREIDASNGWLTGRGMATAGIVMGWIEVGLAILAAVVVVLVFALGGTVKSAFEDTCSTVQDGTSTSC